MAYVNKEIKEKIVTAVKAVMPKDWKASFSVRHGMTLVCTIRKAPLVLNETFDDVGEYGDYKVNPHYYKNHCKNADVVKHLENIFKALNVDNYNKSDVMTDYFDVGYYVELQFGDYKKDFESI